MRSMDVALVFLIFLLQGLQATDAFQVKGDEGDEVTFTCVHSNAIGNIKYFCNKGCTDQDILVTSKKTFDKHKGKYNIEDKGNTFDVTIYQLSLEDSGTYWCGIERVGVDTYNEVFVVVKKREVSDNGDSTQSSASGLSSNKLVYIGAGLGVVVLALAVVLLVFFWHRKRHISSSSGKNHDNTVYATPSTRKHDGQSDATTLTCEEPGPDGGPTGGPTGGPNGATDNLYSTVSAQPASQADGLLYSTVSFSRHTDGSAAAPSTANVTYQTVKPRVSEDDSTVYSNV